MSTTLFQIFCHNNKLWTTYFIHSSTAVNMSLSKFPGDKLAEDLIKPEVWRMTFKFISIVELVKLREVYSTFKDEVDFFLTTQEKPGIFKPKWMASQGLTTQFCQDPLHDVPQSPWIRLNSLQKYWSVVKPMFLSVKVLHINAPMYEYLVDEWEIRLKEFEIKFEDTFNSFVHLECLSINDSIDCKDTNRSYPKLKHLFLASPISGEKQLMSLPSLESLRMTSDFLQFKHWMKKNFGRPSKSCDIEFPFFGDPNYSFQCLSSLPSSLEYLKSRDFFGYSRQFKPMFPKLIEVRRAMNFVDGGHTQFIDFLKDHSDTLKKVTTSLSSINDEELKDILSCLPHGTYINISALGGLERAGKVRQYGLIGGLCRDRNLYLEIDGYCLTESFDDPNRFLDILPPETQSLTLYVYDSIAHNEASCRRLILEILASPLRSTILHFNPTEESKRTLSTAIQGLPETHEVIFEWFYAKPKVIIISRRN